jgi:hypothetical protein
LPRWMMCQGMPGMERRARRGMDSCRVGYGGIMLAENVVCPSWHYLKPRNARQYHKTRAAESLAL